MTKIIGTFGFICGVVLAAFMIATLPFLDNVGDKGALIGYAGMVAAFLLIYFGVRTYRDTALGGTIGFGRAFGAGILIAAIASVCYVATWEVIYYKFMPNTYAKYAQTAVDEARKNGKSEAEIAKVRADMDQMLKRVENPLFVTAMTFTEPFPVGVVIALVSAGVLRRKRRDDDAVLATA